MQSNQNNYIVLVENSKTAKLASAKGWTTNTAAALIFKQGADAVSYCLAKGLANVNLLYRREGASTFLSVPCFQEGEAVKVVPAAGAAHRKSDS